MGMGGMGMGMGMGGMGMGMGNQVISDMMLRQYIDQVFMRYDFNRTGTLNLPELHVFLNELFMMCGIPRQVSYTEAFQALMQMDNNRDGQINKFELFNLFRYLTTPGFRPLPYSFGGRAFGMGGMGYGGMGVIGAPMTSTTVYTQPVGMGVMGMRDPSWNANWSNFGSGW